MLFYIHPSIPHKWYIVASCMLEVLNASMLINQMRMRCMNERPGNTAQTSRRMERRNRVLGSLLGLAVCDAVGTTVEFMPPGSFDPVTDMQGGGKFSLLPGQVRVAPAHCLLLYVT